MSSDTGDILAYFSLSFKEVSLEYSKISKSQVRKIDGISKSSERVRAYLIGQIAKNFAISSNDISLKLILNEVYAIINEAKALVGGRAIILECDKCDRLIAHYKANGFDVLINNENEHFVTMYTHII